MLVAGSLGTLQIQNSSRGPFWGVDFSSTTNHPKCVLDQEGSRMWNFQVLLFFFFNIIFIHKMAITWIWDAFIYLIIFLILTVYGLIHSFLLEYSHLTMLQWFLLWCGLYVISRVWLFVTPWTVAHQAPLSMGFSRQEYWSGLPFSSPGDLPNPGIEPGSPACQADSLPSEPSGKSIYFITQCRGEVKDKEKTKWNFQSGYLLSYRESFTQLFIRKTGRKEDEKTISEICLFINVFLFPG